MPDQGVVEYDAVAAMSAIITDFDHPGTFRGIVVVRNDVPVPRQVIDAYLHLGSNRGVVIPDRAAYQLAALAPEPTASVLPAADKSTQYPLRP